MEELLLTPERCAQMLSLGRTFVYQHLIATGRLESLKIGKRRLIPRDALERFVAQERERQLQGG